MINLKNENWQDWRWQMRNRIQTEEVLSEIINLDPTEKAGIEATKGIFNWKITPYFASLMDQNDLNCPIRRQVVPLSQECEADLVGVVDPLEELANSPVKNLIHNYKDRVAFCVTSECAIYCRYCLRKRMVGDSDFMMKKDELRAGVKYLSEHPEIRDVLLTGGDPLTFSEKQLDWLLSSLREIPHIEIIRIGSRMPVKLPYRITDELCALLKKHRVWLNTHFNHPKELTPAAAEACNRLADAGIPVGNQTVLLKGINDNSETMKTLCEGLIKMRVRPYYIYQAQLIGGTAHLRTPIEKGIEIMKALQGQTSGFAIPKYVLDTPFGKIPLNGTWIRGRAGDHVIVESYSGKLWAEPNPLADSEPGYQLPETNWPADVYTIPVTAEGFVQAPKHVQLLGEEV